MKKTGKSVLVTGGAGFIGSEVLRALTESGFQAVVIDNLSTGVLDALLETTPFYNGDIRNAELLRHVFSKHAISAVIHLAAKIEVEESINQPLAYYDNNVSGLCTVLQICKEFSVTKFIFSSSGTIYGNSNLSLDLAKKIDEDGKLAPLSPYGHSKLIGEQILKDSASAGDFNFISLRYFNVAGASVDGTNGQRRKKPTHIIHVASQAALTEKKEITIYGNDYGTADGTCVRDYIHVCDIADIHVQALAYLLEQSSSHILNCGYGKGYSVKEVVEAFETVNQVRLNVKQGPRRPGDPAFLVGDSTRLEKLLHWKPKHDRLSIICQTAYQWHVKLQGQRMDTF